MKLISIILAAAILCACARSSSTTESPDVLKALEAGNQLAKVNSTVIHEGYIDVLSAVNPRVKAQMSNPTTKKKLLENIIDQELLYQESLKRGLDKQADVQQKAALYKRIVIGQALLEEELTKRAQKYYDEKKDSDFTKVKIAHIQVNFQDEKEDKGGKAAASEAEKAEARSKVEAIHKRLKSGEDFAKIAEELSDDKATRRKGGDLGEVSRDDRRLARRKMQPLVEAAFKLNKDAISDPIETARGYHVIKILTEPTLTPFAEAERLIRFQIQKEVKEDLIKELKMAADIAFAEPVATPSAANDNQTKTEGGHDGHNHE